MNIKQSGDYLMKMDENAMSYLQNNYSHEQIKGFASKLLPAVLEKMVFAGTDISTVINMLETHLPLGGHGTGVIDLCIGQEFDGNYKYSEPTFAVPYGRNNEGQLYKCTHNDRCPMVATNGKNEPPMCGVYSSIAFRTSPSKSRFFPIPVQS